MEIDVMAVKGLVNPLERAKQAGDLITKIHGVVDDLAALRRESIEELLSNGTTQAQIAADLGLTRARIGQILKAGPGPERVFLGTGDIVVVVAGKIESDRADPQPVVAQDDLAAIDQLSNLGRSLGFDLTYEVSPPSGFVRLNRENLIVLCGPRHSPNIREVLESDPTIAFEKDDQGWYLVDRSTGEKYRSGMDQGKPQDFAYFGRLARPDGKGTFLYAAGIHAVGEAAVAHFLSENLSEIYREVKLKRFSTIIGGTYDPEAPTRRVNASERVAPMYRHEGA